MVTVVSTSMLGLPESQTTTSNWITVNIQKLIPWIITEKLNPDVKYLLLYDNSLKMYH